jgi:hypothetical protein
VASGPVALSREDTRWPAGVPGCYLVGLLACCLGGLITGPHRTGAIYRAVPRPCRVPGRRPRHGLVPRAVPFLDRAKIAGRGLGHGLHGHI